ncbi:hypothetical protein [Methylobacterium radiodurans]|uniref:Uncharacterized protein n=1 Tax=Methylobacterium radiodurans TaxID=2202828 RepID=A0A2U8VQF2_9HYPH|nr:hypothetical protein [Methylobacterium radiodurans]AWN35698.1 hypothetical protein DK427_08030 [Methylobacterium radiodurans]
MPGELTDYIAQLSPSGQLVANVAIGLGIAAWGVWQYVSQHRAGKAAVKAEKGAEAGPVALPTEPGHEAFDAQDLLTSAAVLRFLTAHDTIAAHMVIQSEALKTISAAATVWAKAQEDDFQEWRIAAAVERRWNELIRQRGAPPAPPGGWGGGSGG